MPTYCYEHESAAGENCRPRFWLEQNLGDEPLAKCPHCDRPVFRVILPVGTIAPQSDTDLRARGFTKLVKRDNGVYENVTALDGESRYVEAGRPETMPDFDRRKLDG